MLLHPEGEQRHPFEILLNEDVPSSFEGSRGYIRYTLKAVVEQEGTSGSETKTAITVLNEVDLNHEQYASFKVRNTELRSRTLDKFSLYLNFLIIYRLF